MKSTLIFITAAILIHVSEPAYAIVKLSRSNICHDQFSPWFTKTRAVKAFRTVEECLATDGARLPKTQMATRSPRGQTGTSYSRDDWPHWSDFDNDCLNTRHELLQSSSSAPVKLSRSGCTIVSGKWFDPYTGKIFTQSSDLDVDHIVPLYYAHLNGGANWSRAKKEAFANDETNLLLVDDSENQSKSAKGPSEYLPPNQSFRCDYLNRWVIILAKYPTLSMPVSEKRVFNRMLTACD